MDNCVADGPFVNLTVNIGPGFKSQPRCVNRRITDFMGALCGKANVQAALNSTTYDKTWLAIYSGPHLMGHGALGLMVSARDAGP